MLLLILRGWAFGTCTIIEFQVSHLVQRPVGAELHNWNSIWKAKAAVELNEEYLRATEYTTTTASIGTNHQHTSIDWSWKTPITNGVCLLAFRSALAHPPNLKVWESQNGLRDWPTMQPQGNRGQVVSRAWLEYLDGSL